MNYIKHMNAVMHSFAQDVRIVPRHISLYLALFYLWNKLKFINPIHFDRNELMRQGKIGSVNTFIKTMKELDTMGYLHYQPSQSAYRLSSVTIITFDTSTDISTDISTAISSGTSSDISSGNSTATSELFPLNNNYKTIINLKKSNKQITNNREHAHAKAITSLSENENSNEACGKAQKRFVKPKLKDVKIYFVSKDQDEVEAERFMNHFDSNGWRVGGKSPMKDWKAAARNWILNIEKYNRPQAENQLSTKNDKDYGEPL